MSKGNSSAQSQPIAGSVPLPAREAEEPAAGAVTADALSGHWLWQMICDHEAKTDVAVCCCGLWRSAPMSSVGEAAKAWASHALSAAAQVAPSSEDPPLSPSEASTGTLPPAEPLDHLSGEGSRESGE